MTQQITEWIAEDLLPVSIVEGTGFIKLINLTNPTYKIPCRTIIIIMNRISLKYDEKVIEMEKKIQNTTNLSLTTDCWTSRTGQSYITVTAHGLDASFNPVAITLDTKGFAQKHTSANLAERLKQIAENGS